MPFVATQVRENSSKLRALLRSGRLTPVMEYIVDHNGVPKFAFGDYVPFRSPSDPNMFYLLKRGTHTRFEE